MAIRTTPEDVAEVLGDNYDGQRKLDPFIEDANVLTDRVSSKDADGLLSASALRRIETYLAAFFHEAADQATASEGHGGANASFQGQTGMMLQDDKFGQRAMVLDFTGTLAEIQKQATEGKRRVDAIWLGTRYKGDESERTSDQ